MSRPIRFVVVVCSFVFIITMNNGWIKLHRKILVNPIFSSEKGFKIWIWCLLKATHNGNEFYLGRKKIELKQGQFVFGRDIASKELKMSGSTVWWWVSQLEVDRYINIKKTSKYSIITILNWKKYQGVDNKPNNKWTTDRQQIDTIKNVKNVNNVKKKPFFDNKPIVYKKADKKHYVI